MTPAAVYEKIHPEWVTCFKRRDGRVSLFVFSIGSKWEYVLAEQARNSRLPHLIAPPRKT